jgi:GH25 family lysozyme M1 (1,4-beta-N-acetylmuramidase)
MAGAEKQRAGRGKPTTGRSKADVHGKSPAGLISRPAKGSPAARGATPGPKPPAGTKPAAGVTPVPAPAWLRQFAKGIDITPSFQGQEIHINWKKVADAQDFSFRKGMILREPIAFAVLEATVGKRAKPFFAKHWSDLTAQSRKIMRGAYHFFRFGENNDPAGQARTYLDTVGSFSGALPPVVDIEDGAEGGQRRDEILKFLGISPATGAVVDKKRHAEKSAKCVADMKIWMDAVFAATKRPAIIYTFASYWRGVLGDPTDFADHPLWIANYPKNIPASEDPSPHKGIGGWPTWTFWQIAGASATTHFGQSVPGIGRMVDMNLYNGNILNLWLKFINDPTSPLPPGVLF